METNKHKEEELRNTAIEIYKDRISEEDTTDGYILKPNYETSIQTEILEFSIELAKSEAARQYHSKPKTDVEGLREELLDLLERCKNGLSWYQETYPESQSCADDEILDTIDIIADKLNNLQPQKEESDAVELIKMSAKTLQRVVDLKPLIIYSDNLSEEFKSEAQAIDEMILDVHLTLDTITKTTNSTN